MENKKELIDNICNDNDYLLTFQATKEAQNLANALIVLRDNKITDMNDINNVKNAIDALIVILNNQILGAEGDELLDYLSEILDGLVKSKNRLS